MGKESNEGIEYTRTQPAGRNQALGAAPAALPRRRWPDARTAIDRCAQKMTVHEGGCNERVTR